MDEAGPVPPEADPDPAPPAVDVSSTPASPGSDSSSYGRVRVVLRVRPLIRREYGYPLAAEKQSHSRHVRAACRLWPVNRGVPLTLPLSSRASNGAG